MTVGVVVNGEFREASRVDDTNLLAVLRSLGLTGAKEACGRGECGACTVLIGGVTRMACITLVAQVDDDVITVEGLGDTGARLVSSFADHTAFQCGYCTPGHVVSAAAVVADARSSGRRPNREDVRRQLNGNLCRCTGYTQILDAVADAIDIELGIPDDQVSGSTTPSPLEGDGS